MSRTTSATAHPAVMTPVTSWSFASSGGGGAGRAGRSRVSFTPSGYEVRRRRGRPDGGRVRSRSLGSRRLRTAHGVMYLVHALGRPDEGYR